MAIDLRKHMSENGINEVLRRLMWNCIVAGKYILKEISKSNRMSAGTKNASGENQMKLDVQSDNIFLKHLEELEFSGYYASEEKKNLIMVKDGGEYVVAVDPLDGSSLVDVDFSIGTIIGIHKKDALLTTGRKSLVAAMYILYGPLTVCAYSAGKGSFEFVLDPAGEFIFSTQIRMKEKGSIYSIGGKRKEWTVAHAAYVENLEKDGYKPRYSGCFVADTHQILIKGGGVFSYPALRDSPWGKLRVLFELQPMALIIEQAGGKATDGNLGILDIRLAHLHQRSPVYAGSKTEVELTAPYNLLPMYE